MTAEVASVIRLVVSPGLLAIIVNFITPSLFYINKANNDDDDDDDNSLKVIIHDGATLTPLAFSRL